MLERHGYSESELPLERGDLVFAHTDGLIEARREGVMYGTERLSQLVAGLAASHAAQELVRGGARGRDRLGRTGSRTTPWLSLCGAPPEPRLRA